MTMKLSITLVPKNMWGQSLRNLLPRSKWDSIRQLELDRAGKRCEVCGHQGTGLICHEVWDYDDERHVASLKGFQIVCKTCDLVHHIGRAGAIGHGDEAIQHFMKVNAFSRSDAIQQVRDAMGVWIDRNKYDWTIDWGIYEQDVIKKQ
ncbi:HNH endonuclease [Chloroflexota bacterium]